MSKLKEILDHKRAEVAARKVEVPLLGVVESLQQALPSRPFADAIRSSATRSLACIAEIKRASPSKGIIAKHFRPETIAKEYEQGGASALSILTDEKFFLGSAEYLRSVRERTSLPILRKDFIVDEYQIYESRVMGADAILLIVAALKESDLLKFMTLARDLDLECLVECHKKTEIDRAVNCGATMIGVNNRDLDTFEVSLETSVMLKRFIPNAAVSVSESGIRNAHHVDLLREAGYDAILVGEVLMSQENRARGIAELLRTRA
ncbi:MAG TPA: indole-3-glycerol phosphate synthase TrpC [Bacteroidota bacterium]|nr:indole-3-glycerol phosphate synthase TrpC [Bacteroidota bacterium]